jgi:hypothetical protein
MSAKFEMVVTPIFVNGPKTSDGRRLLIDYGLCYASINNIGGIMFSGDYVIDDGKGPYDKPGFDTYYTEPVIRDSRSFTKEEAYGFIN